MSENFKLNAHPALSEFARAVGDNLSYDILRDLNQALHQYDAEMGIDWDEINSGVVQPDDEHLSALRLQTARLRQELRNKQIEKQILNHGPFFAEVQS